MTERRPDPAVVALPGGTGFVGRRTAAAFAAAGCAVRVLTRDPARAAGLAPGVEVVDVPRADRSALVAAFAGVDVCVHLAAALPGPGVGPEILRSVNVDGAAAAAEAAAAASVRRFVLVSSAGVYGDGRDARPHREDDPPRPGTDYERSKLAGEEAVRAALRGSRTEVVVLRPSGVYGAERPATVAFARAAARRRIFLHGPARVLLSPVVVDDVARAILAAASSPAAVDEVLNVAGPEPIDYADWIDAFARVAGRAPLRLRPPRFAAPLLAWAARLAGRGPDAVDRLRRPFVNRAADPSKARRVLGFEPEPYASAVARVAKAALAAPR